jgi:hypothetical protein
MSNLSPNLLKARDIAKRIDALANNPQWTSERRWRIAELAAELHDALREPFNLDRGTVVRAIRHLDRVGADVIPGTLGVVFEAAGAYGDGGGPMVRWVVEVTGENIYTGRAAGACNVYEGDVEVVR